MEPLPTNTRSIGKPRAGVERWRQMASRSSRHSGSGYALRSTLRMASQTPSGGPMGLMLALKSSKSSRRRPSARNSEGLIFPCTGRRFARFSCGWFDIESDWPLEDASTGVGYG